MSLTRVGIWVYPGTHLNRIPHTHSGRIRASGYLGIPIEFHIPTHPGRFRRSICKKNRRVEGVPKKLNCRLLITVSITLFWLSWGPPHGAHPSNFSYTPCPNSGLPLISGWVGWAQMPVCPLFKGGLDKRVFGYTQLPTQIDFDIPTQVEFVRVGICVYPATHLNRIPYTHSGRICASGYLGIPSYPLDIPRYALISNSAHPLRSKLREWVFCRICGSGYLGIPSYPLKSNLREWVFGYTQLPT